MTTLEVSACNKSRRVITGVIVLLFVLTLVALDSYGKKRRVYVSEGMPASVAIENPQDAYALWKSKGVKGRVLVLFGNYPHFIRSADYTGVREITSNNFVEYSAFINIVRKIYFVVPDEGWEEKERLNEVGVFRTVSGMERGLYLYNLVGIPIIATTPTSLPPLSDPPLVYINKKMFDEAMILKVIASKGIKPDIIITYKGD